MKELFNTVNSFIDKFLVYTQTLFENVKQATEEVKTWVSYLPVELIAAAGIIIVLLIVFRILGR